MRTIQDKISKRILFILTVVGISLISVALVSQNVLLSLAGGSYLTNEQIENITHYNGIIFDKFTSYQADIEGALAVGGDATFGVLEGFDIGGAGGEVYNGQYAFIGEYNNSKDLPTLLLGGDSINIVHTPCNIYSGDIVMKASAKGAYESSANKFVFYDTGAGHQLQYWSDENVDEYFTMVKKETQRVSSLWPQANEETVTADKLKSLGSLDLSKYENKGLAEELNVLAITIDELDYTVINEIQYLDAFFNYDLVVFNILAKKAFIGNGSILYKGAVYDPNIPNAYRTDDILDKFAEKVVWNFPNATEIEMESFGLIGSVIAPNALFEAQGGSVNGLLICDSFVQKGGMELHAFNMSKNYYKITEDEEETEETESETVIETESGDQTESECETETEPESQTESEQETETEPESQTESEQETETEPESQTESERETETEPESQTESESETETERQTESERETETERQTESERETESERQTESERETESERQTESERETESERQTESERETESERQTESERETESERQTESERETESERQTESERETESERQTESERETESERQTESERESESERETESERQTESERETESERQTESERETESDSQSESEGETESENAADTEEESEIIRRTTDTDCGKDSYGGKNGSNSDNRNNGNQSSNVKTGDILPVTLFLLIAGTSLGTFIYTLRRKKK